MVWMVLGQLFQETIHIKRALNFLWQPDDVFSPLLPAALQINQTDTWLNITLPFFHHHNILAALRCPYVI